MKDSLGFTFNGTHSSALGVMNVHGSQGLFEEEMYLNTNLNNTYLRANGNVIASKEERAPIEFTITLYYSSPYQSNGTVRRIINWLKTDKFMPMSFDNYPNFMVYARLVNIVGIRHNGINEGMIELHFATNSGNIFSLPHKTQIYTITEPTTILLNHEGDSPIFPTIWLEKNGTGEFSIFNKATNKTMTFTEVIDKEKVFMDGEKRIIYSDGQIIGIYRGNTHNRIWLELVDNYYDGTNELLITGNGKVQFELQYKYNTIL